MRLFADAFRMIRDVGRASRVINLWGGLLNIPQLLGGLWFVRLPEGRWVLITLVFTLLVAGQIHRARPYSRLTGLCHAPWLLLLPWLVLRLRETEHEPVLHAWIVWTLSTIAISLIFDAADVARWVRGQRTFAWKAD